MSASVWKPDSAITISPADAVLSEVFTISTPSQSDFVLPFTYVQGVSALNVFINGVHQVSGVDYLELTTTTVRMVDHTFVIGDTVEVIGNIQLSEQEPGQSQLRVDLADLSGSDMIGFTPSGTGAVATTVQNKLRATSVSAADFGAVADGIADSSTPIQAAISAQAALGGGFVDLAAGIYMIDATLVLPSKVILRGQGSSSTILKAKNSLNATVIKSYNYDSLVGSDTWLVASGNQHSYGLMNLKIDGNKANQTLGSGVKFYGKRLFVSNVIITSCKEEGWHSEGNYLIPGSPDSTGEDMPEGRIDGLRIWNCDSHGFVFRGQHDSYISSLFVGTCAGWGVRIETSAGSHYSGNADFGLIHSYANILGGVYLSSRISCHQMISESNFGIGLQCDSWQNQISSLQLYTNCRTTGTYQAVITTNQNTITNCQIKDTGDSKSGIQITGASNNIDVQAIGGGSTGVGIDINAAYNTVRGFTDGWTGAGGIGLRTGNSAQCQHCKITLNIGNNKTGWNNASVGSFNSYNISGFVGAGNAFFSGSGPNITKNELWNVKGVTNGITTVLSRSKVRSVNTVDFNSTTEQEITIAHGLLTAPLIQDVRAQLSYLNSNLTWAMSRFYVRSVDATNVKVRFKASVAAGGADTGDILLDVEL